jgi:hypothetical protein
MMYIPLQQTLQSLLEDKTILKEVKCVVKYALSQTLISSMQVTNPPNNTTGKITSFRDGKKFSENRVVS